MPIDFPPLILHPSYPKSFSDAKRIGNTGDTMLIGLKDMLNLELYLISYTFCDWILGTTYPFNPTKTTHSPTKTIHSFTYLDNPFIHIFLKLSPHILVISQEDLVLMSCLSNFIVSPSISDHYLYPSLSWPCLFVHHSYPFRGRRWAPLPSPEKLRKYELASIQE